MQHEDVYLYLYPKVGRLIAAGSFFLKKPATVQFFSELQAGLDASVQINPWRAFVEEKN